MTETEKPFILLLGEIAEASDGIIIPMQRAMIEKEDEQWFINLGYYPIPVVGEAWSLRHARQEHLKEFDVETIDALSEEDKAAFHEMNRTDRDRRNNGTILGRLYSQLHGRHGSRETSHISRMLPITEAAFKEAKSQGWVPDLENNTKSPYLRRSIAHFAKMQQQHSA